MAVLVLIAGAAPFHPGAADTGGDHFLSEATRRWCQAHGPRDDLQVVVVGVRFRAEPPLFTEGDGVVVAPVALDLPRSQRLIEVASQPNHLRRLATPRVLAVAWEYAGRVHRDMRFSSIALVERAPRARARLPAQPTFEGLDLELRAEASARAADLEEHGLHKCAAFSEWARRTAGPPPHPEQILRLVRAVATRSQEKNNESEDVCAAVRAKRYTPHHAQVTVVMAAREVGIPAFGFAAASAEQVHLVGTYVDQSGWILVDVERPEEGWFTGGSPLLTMAPLLGGFAASRHDYWSPVGAAYAKGDWGISALSTTEWRGLPAADRRIAHTTEALVRRLSEVCP